MHPRKHDDFRSGFHRLARQREAVPDEIGDAVKYLRGLIIMGEDDGVPRPLHRHDGMNVLGVNWPLDSGNGVAHLGVKVVGPRNLGAAIFWKRWRHSLY